jgi:hypothetical protein
MILSSDIPRAVSQLVLWVALVHDQPIAFVRYMMAIGDQYKHPVYIPEYHGTS